MLSQIVSLHLLRIWTDVAREDCWSFRHLCRWLFNRKAPWFRRKETGKWIRETWVWMWTFSRHAILRQSQYGWPMLLHVAKPILFTSLSYSEINLDSFFPLSPRTTGSRDMEIPFFPSSLFLQSPHKSLLSTCLMSRAILPLEIQQWRVN